jgi:hypothetical protein
MHALNNAIGFMFCTERDLARACEANLRDHAFDLRDMHVAPTGWYSSEVMATALLITGVWRGAFQWVMQPLHVDPAVLQAENVAGAVVHLRVKQRWVAMRYWEEEFWLLDSQEEPQRLSPLEYRSYVKRHRDAFPIIRAQGGDDTSIRAAAATCSIEGGRDDTFGAITDTMVSATTAGDSSGEGDMVTPSADTPPVPSTAQRTCSQHSLEAGDGGDGVDQAPCQGHGDDLAMSDCMEVDPMDTTDAIDRTPPVLAIAEQISADDAQALICEAHHERAVVIAAGAERMQQADAEQLGDGDTAMLDFQVEIDTTPSVLAIAEHWPEDAQQIFYANYNERALQLEREELEAKASFMNALAARGGN